jgi:hypothetical protein
MTFTIGKPMNHHDYLPAWPVVSAWSANGFIAWLVGGLSPLQVLLLLVTLGFTMHRWWLLKKRGKDQS